MFSIAELLDRAKLRGNIESDYRLAKVIGISHGTMTGYRSGKSKPDSRVLEQLCALSGDDIGVLSAELQAERERTPEGRQVWLGIARRLSGQATGATLALVFAIAFVAGFSVDARASDHPLVARAKSTCYTSYLLPIWHLLSDAFRLRWIAAVFRLFSVCAA
jgi:transcriptional regulator with XRE-family HTH domain